MTKLGLEVVDMENPDNLTRAELETLGKYHNALKENAVLFEAWLQDESFDSVKQAVPPASCPHLNFSKMDGFSTLKTIADKRIADTCMQDDVDSLACWLGNQKKWGRDLKAHVQKKFNEYRSAVRTYISSHKTTARAAAKQQAPAPGAAEAQAPKRRQPKGPKQVAAAIFNAGMDCPVFPAVADFDAAAPFEYSTPFAIRCVNNIVKMRMEDNELRTSVDFFETSLTQTMMSKGAVRAVAYPSCEVLKAAMQHFTTKCADYKGIKEDMVDIEQFQVGDGDAQVASKKVSRLVSTSVCGIGGTFVFIGLDYEDVGSIRVSFKGERSYAWIRLDALEADMASKGVDASPDTRVKKNLLMSKSDKHKGAASFKYDMQTIEKHVNGMSAEGWEQITKDHPETVYKFKASPRDLVVTPQGWLMAEMAVDKKLALCFRLPVLTKNMEALKQATWLQQGESAWIFMKILEALEDSASELPADARAPAAATAALASSAGQ